MNNTHKPWTNLGFYFLLISLFSGGLYLIIQLVEIGEIKDPLFIGLLCGSSIIIYKASQNVHGQFQLLVSSLPKSSEFEELKGIMVSRIFSVKKSLPLAIIFASIFGIVAIALAPWEGTNILNWSLAGFMVASNLITGLALYTIVMYFQYAIEVGKKLEIELWDRSNPSLRHIISINDILTKSVAMVAAFGLSAAMFSVFTIEAPIYAFSIFSIAMVASTFVIPIIPVTNQIRIKKKEHIVTLSKLIQQEYNAILRMENNNKPVSADTFEALIKTAKSVSSVRAFPPVAEKTLNSAAYVTLVTMLPATIDLLMRTFGKL